MSRSGLFWLVLADLCVAAVVAVMWTRPPSPWEPPNPILPEIPAVAGVAADGPVAGSDSLSETTERPLFFASRRPVDKVVEKPEESEAKELAIEVSGFFSSADGAGGAILRVDGQPVRVMRGEKVGRWTLESVAGLSAVLRADNGESRRLELERAPQPSAAAAPAPSSAVATRPPSAGGEAVTPIAQDVRDKRDAYLKAVAAARSANKAALQQAREARRDQ